MDFDTYSEFIDIQRDIDDLQRDIDRLSELQFKLLHRTSDVTSTFTFRCYKDIYSHPRTESVTLHPDEDFSDELVEMIEDVIHIKETKIDALKASFGR